MKDTLLAKLREKSRDVIKYVKILVRQQIGHNFYFSMRNTLPYATLHHFLDQSKLNFCVSLM